VNPGARFLSHLSHWHRLAPRRLVESLSRAFEKHVMALTGDVGGDSLGYAAQVENHATRAKLRELALATVIRAPAAWASYCAKPLKLAPRPDAPLAECLAPETALNLDWEIDRQAPDGAWLPNWDWQGDHPEHWELARREWQGELTLRALRSLRAYGRLEHV